VAEGGVRVGASPARLGHSIILGYHRLAALGLFVVAIGFGSPVRGKDLPVWPQKVFLLSEENRTVAPTPTDGRNLVGLGILQQGSSASASLELGPENFTSNPNAEWSFKPTSKPGRVFIVDGTGTRCLDTTNPAETTPAQVSMAAFTGSGTQPLTQEWRLIEEATGTYLIQNAATGRLLETDPSAPRPDINGITKVRMLGRTTAPNRQWRILRTSTRSTLRPSQQVAPVHQLPEFKPPKTSSGSATTFGSNKPDVTVTVTLTGDRTNQVFATIHMKADGNGLTLEGDSVPFPWIIAPPNKKVYLAPGTVLKEVCFYKDLPTPAPTPDIVVVQPGSPPADGFVASFSGTMPPMGPSPTSFTPPTPKPKLIHCCICNGNTDPTPAEGTTSVTVYLEAIQFRFDGP